jgi:hypothetical protein
MRIAAMMQVGKLRSFGIRVRNFRLLTLLVSVQTGVATRVLRMFQQVHAFMQGS